MTATDAATPAVAATGAPPGPFLGPGDDGYDGATRGYNAAVPQRPPVVVEARGPDDVVAAVRHARRHGLSVTPHRTGHGATVPADGVLVATRGLRGVEIDPAARTARFGAGVLVGELVDAAAEHGLAVLAGSSPAVGAVGYHLGGGLPVLGRRYGFASDHVRAMEVVTAAGTVLRVTPGTEPDLFWALLGARGAFGVVVSMEVDLVAVPTVVAGNLWYTGDIAGALRAWAEWTRRAPGSVCTSVVVLDLPDVEGVPEGLRGRRAMSVQPLGDGPEDEVLAAVDDLCARARPDHRDVRSMPYRELSSIYGDPEGPLAYDGRSSLLADLDGPGVDEIVAHLDALPAGRLRLVELRHLEGRFAEPSRRRGVTGRADGRFALYTTDAPGSPERPSGADALHERMRPWSRGACAGLLSGPSVTAAQVRAGFTDADLRTLDGLKRRHDPDDLFVALGFPSG